MSGDGDVVVVKLEPDIAVDPLEQVNVSITEENKFKFEEPVDTATSTKPFKEPGSNEEVLDWIYDTNSTQEDAVVMEKDWRMDTQERPHYPTCNQALSSPVCWSLLAEHQGDHEEENRYVSRKKRDKSTHHISFRFHGFLAHSTQDGNKRTVSNCELVDSKGDTYLVVGGYDSPSGFSIVLKRIKNRKKGAQESGWIENELDDWGDKTDVDSSVETDQKRLVKRNMVKKDEQRVENKKEILKINEDRVEKIRTWGKKGKLPVPVGDFLEQTKAGKEDTNMEFSAIKNSKEIPKKPSENGNFGTTWRMRQGSTAPWLKRFPCRYCNRRFYYKEKLKIHEHKMHDLGSQLECDACGKRFFTKRGLRGHLILKHKLIEKPYNCNACGNGFVQKRFHEKHMKLHSGVFYCKICEKHFKNVRSFNDHMTAHSGVLPYSCDFCKKGFVGKFNMWRHVKAKHLGQRIQCGLCPKSFTRKESKEVHVNHVHFNIKPFICDFCKKSFVTKTAVRTHMVRHVPDRSFLCDTCGAVFSSRSRLSVHISAYHNFNRITNSKQPATNSSGYQCTVCGKVISSITNLKTHYVVHSNERPFACTVCGKTFKRKEILKQHMGAHSGAKYQCTLCNRSYNRESNLRRHKNVHTQAKVYQCPTCDKKFSGSTNLRNHMLAHSGIKRFACNICDVKLSDSRSFKNHMKRHGVDTIKFECSLCKLLFKSKNLLEKHNIACKKINRQDEENFNVLNLTEFQPLNCREITYIVDGTIT